MTFQEAKIKHAASILPVFKHMDRPATEWVHIPPVDCVELIIYDNDGPEGFFDRVRFKRSLAAIAFLKDVEMSYLQDLNFELNNHWVKQLP